MTFNLSARCTLNGQTKSKDKHNTEVNREFVRDFAEKVILGKEVQYLGDFIGSKELIQHNPTISLGFKRCV